jgi:subtilisin family serine protease
VELSDHADPNLGSNRMGYVQRRRGRVDLGCGPWRARRNISYEMSASSTVASAAQYFQNRGGVVTIAAGNSAAYLSISDNPYVLTVSATDDQDNLASWSNMGTIVDVSAPGVNIYTTFAGGGYGPVSGTSFAAPVTAGVAALVLATNPSLSGAQAQSIVKKAVDDLGTPGWDGQYGYGRVNAAAAVAAAMNGNVADNIPPSVGFVSPKNGGTVAATTSVEVSAADNNAVASVTLKVDGFRSRTDTFAPYTFALNTMGLPNGTHTLTAVASDAAAI